MEELRRIENELLRLGLQQTLQCFRNETRCSISQPEFRTEPIHEVESSACSSPRIESSMSEPFLAPLTIAQPVYSEQSLFPTRSTELASKSSKGLRKPSPHFIVERVLDQMRFQMTEISNKALSDKSADEYPVTPLSFSARSSTSKESITALDPPSFVTAHDDNPFTWDLSATKTQVDTTPRTQISPLQEGPIDPNLEGGANDSPIRIPRAESLPRVDSLNDSLHGSQDLADAFNESGATTDPAEDVEDNATIVSLPESDTSPFAEFVFASTPEPSQEARTSMDEPKQFSFPQTPQGSDAGDGAALNALRSFNSTRSTDFVSVGTNSSKTLQSLLGLDLPSNSLSSRQDAYQSGDLESPAANELPPLPLPLIFNPHGTQKRVSLSLNAYGVDLCSLLNDIQTSKVQKNIPLDMFPEELWMNKTTNKDRDSEYLLPRYTFSQSYIDDTYDIIELQIFHKKGKTGFESNKDLYVEMGDIIAGRYQVIKVVGSAVFSKAIKAVDLKLNRSVCLKMVKNVKDYFDQSLDEIKLLRYLNRLDPKDIQGVVRLLDFFYYREHLFLVFELLKENLYEIQQKSIKEHGSIHALGYYFSLSRIQSIARQILVTLRFLHSKKIIHSDLKPENVLIRNVEEGTIKVIDLGSSCFVTDFLGSYVQSRSYRAPEVILGVDYNTKIDLWSLGCMLCELFTGSVLFQSACLAELLAKIESVRGSIPSWMLYQGKFSTKYYTTSMKLFRKNPSNQEYETLCPVPCPLSTILKNAEESFVDFVSMLLMVDPNKRPPAEEMLKHPWLC